MTRATGAITPGTSTAGAYTVTYTIAAAGGCAVVTATANVTVTALPAATITYAGSPFCKTLGAGQAVTRTGTAGGSYSAAPAGLTIDAVTGAINPGTSTAGAYTVTYTIAAAGGCAVVTATTPVTITSLPTATITYAGSPFCKTLGAGQPVTQTGTAGGAYSAAPAGLTIDAVTGAINPGTSTAGIYTVTYTIAAAGGCAVVTATTSVTITTLPAATISYVGSPFCKTLGAGQAVTLTGTAGGTYTAAPAGLTIDAVTGAINPGTSTAGAYTVTYTIAAAGGCAIVTATTPVTITALPVAAINYAGSPFCKTLGAGQAVTQTGTPGGAYSAAPAGLTIDAVTGSINPGTSTAGIYTVTYTIAAAGGCAVVTATTSVTITTLPTASISYTGSPWCSTAGLQSVTLVGTAGGVYSAAPAGLSINAATGAITVTASTIGIYTVTYTIAAAGGCAVVTATANVEITATPVLSSSLTPPPICSNTAFSYNPTCATGGTSFSWTRAAIAGITPAGPTSGVNNPNETLVNNTLVPVAVTYVYTLNAGGCNNVQNVVVNVIPLPPTPAIGGGGKTDMCRGTNGQFYSVPLNAGNTYTWSVAPAGTTKVGGGNPADNFIVLNFPNAGVYTLSVQEFTSVPIACGGPIQTLTITVYDNPVVDAGAARTVCAGEPTTLGAVLPAVTASGGSGTFTYLWTPSFGLDDASSPNPVATTNATRTYTLNVNDIVSGCATVIRSVVVTVTPLPTVYNVTGPDYYCFGTPGITLSLSGSQAGVNYQLYKNAVIEGAVKPGTGAGLTWAALTAGTYTVKATNTVSLCMNNMNGSVTVAENPDVIINSITPIEPSCFSSSDGVISISASGGTGALQYSVNNGATYQSSGIFGSLSQGTYNIIVKDTRGCTKTGIQVLTQPPALSITSITVTNSISCFGGANGSSRVVAGGGTPIYTYQWYNDSGLTSPIVGQVTDEVTGRTAGTYYVKITDFNGCWISANITLTQPAVLNAVVTPTNATCNGVSDGIINVTAPTGGSGAYEYSRDGGLGWQATGLFNGLAPATYDVRIRDLANPACAITLNSSVIITQPNVLSAVVTSTNVTCNPASDGTITVSSPTGGYGTYDYSIGGLWQPTGTFTGLASGTYAVSIRDRAHPACVIVVDPTRIITQPAVLSATLNSTNITCFGANNGTITITAPLGGSGTYQFTVNGGTTWQSLGSFTNLAPAVAYDVRMRDAVNTGCTLTLSGNLTLTQPNILSATVTSTNVTCSGAGDGTITITNPLGGYGTYDYTVNGGTVWQPGGNFTALIPGFYNVQIRDRANPACVITVQGSLQITQPAALSANVARTNVTCNGANDGTITISTPSGGYGTYEYSIGGPWQVSGNFIGLAPNTYTVSMRDQLHPACVMVLGPNPVITQPAVLAATVTTTNVTCNAAGDGIIAITGATGGYGTYQYSINGVTWQGASTFINVAPATYNVSMRDAANIGCVLPLGSHIITQPNVLAATLSRTNVTCFGAADGTISVTGATGGYGNYEYTINGGGSWQVSGIFAALGPGLYNVVIRDRDHISCIKVLNSSYQITQPAALTAVVTPTNATCNGVSDGIINVTAPTGGSGAYEYSRDGGLGWQATGLFNGLAPATYDVRIRDLANPACAITLNSSVIITQPNVLSAVVTSTNVTCNPASDGTITVSSPTGGYGTYDYSIGGLWQPTGTFTGLASGTYAVSIRDRAHPACVIVVDPTRIITQPAVLSATLNSTNITCFGANNGTITITAPLGGSGTYQFTVNGGTTWQSLGSFTNLAPAVAYDVRMRDAVNTGCTLTLSGNLTLTQPNILSATVTSTNVTCSGAGDGTITITNPLGGYGTYDYTVNGGTVWQASG